MSSRATTRRCDGSTRQQRQQPSSSSAGTSPTQVRRCVAVCGGLRMNWGPTFACVRHCVHCEWIGCGASGQICCLTQVRQQAAVFAWDQSAACLVLLRWQHAEAAVAAIQFICRHEPDPGAAVCGCMCRASNQAQLNPTFACIGRSVQYYIAGPVLVERV